MPMSATIVMLASRPRTSLSPVPTPKPSWFANLLEEFGDLERRSLLSAGFDCGCAGLLPALLAISAARRATEAEREILAAGFELGSRWNETQRRRTLEMPFSAHPMGASAPALVAID